MPRESLFVEVPNLLIDSVFNQEFRVERVTFVSGNKIRKNRKLYGITKTIADIEKRFGDRPKTIIKPDATYAHIWTKKSYRDDLSEEYLLINDAIYVLASSNFGITTSREPSLLGRHDSKLGATDSSAMFSYQKHGWNVGWSRKGPVDVYRLNQDIKNNTWMHFFLKAVKVLNRELVVSVNWRKKIRRAVVLAGRSQYEPTLEDAFLRNMVAIEVLLSNRGDSFPEVLVNRIDALFWWLSESHGVSWKGIIAPMYKCRCEIVHDGGAKEFKPEYLLNSEMVLRNLLNAICSRTRIIKSKNDLLQLTEKVAAKKTLGMAITEIPSTFTFVRMHYTQEQLEKLAKSHKLHY